MQLLADRIGLTRQAVDRMEKDRSNPSVSTLRALSTAFGVTIDELLYEKELSIEFLANRKRSGLTKTRHSEIQSRVELELERRDWLYHGLAIILPESLPARKTSGNLDPEKIELEAEHLRNIWNLGEDPIVNISEAFENNGIEVITVEADAKFDGLCGKSSRGAFVVENLNYPRDRQRFNLAHELAHLYLNVSDDNEGESFAHRFAGAFLFPRKRIVQELGAYRNRITVRELQLLKDKYGISQQEIIRRAKDLQIINEASYLYLVKMYRAKGWHKEEPSIGNDIKRESSSRAERLLERGLSEGFISRSDAAKKFPEFVKDNTDEAIEIMNMQPTEIIKLQKEKRDQILRKAAEASVKEYESEEIHDFLDLEDE